MELLRCVRRTPRPRKLREWTRDGGRLLQMVGTSGIFTESMGRLGPPQFVQKLPKRARERFSVGNQLIDDRFHC